MQQRGLQLHELDVRFVQDDVTRSSLVSRGKDATYLVDDLAKLQ